MDNIKTLRTKIYAVCQDHLRGHTRCQFSEASLLNEGGYDLNDLEAPMFNSYSW